MEAESAREYAGPGWPIVAPTLASRETGSITGILLSGAASRWYIGAGVSLLWLIGAVPDVLRSAASPLSAIIGIGAVLVYAVAFCIVPPLNWVLPMRARALSILALWVLSFGMFPWLGLDIAGLWTYVGVAVGMSLLGWRTTTLSIFGLGALAAVFGILQVGWIADVLIAPAIIVSISMMMAAFARTLASMNQLRATQREMERLAAERERNRIGRDIHDILGHTLTVITVKAELAGRLLGIDAERAGKEITEVEALARGALADVRATVAGFRGVNIVGELAVARAALDSAGIAAELPSTADAVPEARRELAGWVVREGVTNVLRHSRATRCRVRIDSHMIEVADNGIGPSEPRDAAASNGLTGLRERVEAVGGTMSVGRSDLGGFSLRVAS